MNKESAVKIIKDSLKTMREGSNQYGVPEWKFKKVTDSITKAENALAYFESAQKNGETEPSTSNNNERDAITLWREYFASLEGNDVAMFLFHNADRLNAVLA